MKLSKWLDSHWNKDTTVVTGDFTVKVKDHQPSSMPEHMVYA